MINPRYGRQRKLARRGFTLTEVLLVLAILVMIGGMAVVGIMQAQGRATRQAAQREIGQIESACTQFRIQMLRYPNTLEELYNLPNGVNQQQWGGPYLTKGNGNDPWGNPYQYAKDENTYVLQITSAGPDGQPGNSDDVPTPAGG